MTAFVRSNAALVNCGIDPVIEDLVEERNLGRLDVVALRLLYGAKAFTLLCVPKRIWKDRDARRRLLDLKHVALRLKLKVVVVSASGIQKLNRRTATEALAKSRALRPTRAERGRIIKHVLANGGSTLSACASLVASHPDPHGLVLNLCATGWLRLNRSTPLGPQTLIGVAS